MSYQTKLNWLTNITYNEWILPMRRSLEVFGAYDFMDVLCLSIDRKMDAIWYLKGYYMNHMTFNLIRS